MDEYQYDELSMAIGFAHFATEMLPQASPTKSPMMKPPVSPRQRSLRWQPSGHFFLSRSNSYHDHDNFPAIVPEHIEESVLERLQVEIGVIEEEEGSPPIIDGPIYTDDEILKLDLFHRSRSNTVSGSGKNGAFEGYFPNSPVRPVIDLNLPSGRSSRSSNGKKSENEAQSSPGVTEPTDVPENGIAQKAQIRNLLMGIAGRQRPSDLKSTEAASENTQNSTGIACQSHPVTDTAFSNSNANTSVANSSSDAHTINGSTDQKSQIRNALLAGLTARKKPTEPSKETSSEIPVTAGSTQETPKKDKDTETTLDTSIDQKAQVRNMLMAGLASRQKPVESLNNTTLPSTSTDSANAPLNKDTSTSAQEQVDQKAQVRNMLMAGLASRQKPVEIPQESVPASEASASTINVTSSKDTPSHAEELVDQKAQVRNMLMTGLAARQKTIETSTTTPNKEPSTSTETPTSSFDQKAQIRNALLAGLTARQKPAEITSPNPSKPSSATIATPLSHNNRLSDITETDTWSPELRALPPLPNSPISPPLPPGPMK